MTTTVDPARLRAALDALTSGDLANAPIRRKLLRIVTLAAETFVDCYAAAMVSGHDGEVCTNHAAYRLDQAQYRSGAGPAAVAMASGQAVRVDAIAGCPWTHLRRAAAENRIASSLSLPLICAGAPIGVLSLYSGQAGAFAGCETAGAEFAAAASTLLGPAGPATWPRPRT